MKVDDLKISWTPSNFVIFETVREFPTEEENKYQMKCFWNLSVLFDYFNKYIFIFFSLWGCSRKVHIIF